MKLPLELLDNIIEYGWIYTKMPVFKITKIYYDEINKTNTSKYFIKHLIVRLESLLNKWLVLYKYKKCTSPRWQYYIAHNKNQKLSYHFIPEQYVEIKIKPIYI